MTEPHTEDDLTYDDRKLIAKAERSLGMLKRHRADFNKVTGERVRLMERFILNPRRLSSTILRIINAPLSGL